ncbi:subtilisin-like protease SBT3.9 [Magnolia sinica]|uniref:subtilisin-like protease SBT3.9 n=1 Tax=Magnolia sinica TaxID=86752 RepID=UPI00265AD9D6|nr:subtilisin-like protease SBT3.9 [Magnolia sinica]
MGGTHLLLALVLHLSIFFSIYASNVHIVYMGERHHSEPQITQDSHHGILSDVLGSKEAATASMLYSYRHGFSGFAAVLTEAQAKLIADFPGVVRVIPNHILRLHTTRSWDFLRLEPETACGLLWKSQSGSGSIIGIMDTGVWPESKSFKEDGMDDIPSHWKGICQEGEGFNRSNCNRKLIGARWYIKGYEAEYGSLDTSSVFEFLSPRDAVGHGTHTSSIAAGAFVRNASFLGLARGLARGGAHDARISVYKVCWATGGCSSADLLAAFDDAISDGVDVISVSLGSSPPLAPYIEDVVAIGSFHAVDKGIVVVCSAGNSGPYPQTIQNTAPWLTTVAASTIDRAFPIAITLGNNWTFVGQSLYSGEQEDRFYPLVYAEDIALVDVDYNKARSCDTESLNATLARGKVVLCFQSQLQNPVASALETVREVEGIALIFAQFPTNDVITSMAIPCVQVDFEIGTVLLNYIEKVRNPVVKFGLTKTTIGTLISPEVAFFSSRGPSSLSPSILKPDIAAPGMNILASWSPASSSTDMGLRAPPLNFKIESGTSMACPHISGIVALLKSIHPHWSPAAIKSALITTASIKDEYGQNMAAEGSPHKIADPFDYGGGHVDPNKAADPGLIYDTRIKDHISFLCSMGYNNSAISSMTRHRIICNKTSWSQVDLNLPSISIPHLRKPLTVSRTVTNVGPVTSVYIAHVEAPPGVMVSVKPWILLFNSTVKKQKFKVSFFSQLRVQGRYSFGSLSWTDGVHVVRIPLVVRTVIDEFYMDS